MVPFCEWTRCKNRHNRYEYDNLHTSSSGGVLMNAVSWPKYLVPGPSFPQYYITSTLKGGSGNFCMDFVHSRGICIEPMGCELSHDCTHACIAENPSSCIVYIVWWAIIVSLTDLAFTLYSQLSGNKDAVHSPFTKRKYKVSIVTVVLWW